MNDRRTTRYEAQKRNPSLDVLSIDFFLTLLRRRRALQTGRNMDNRRALRSKGYVLETRVAVSSASGLLGRRRMTLKGHCDPPPVMPLPEDLMYEVFLRLPWPSLLQFRCVSKVFLELIDSPLFIQRRKKYDNDSVSDFTVIITNPEGMYSMDFNFPHNISHVEEKKLHPPLKFNHKFTGCSNGILCLMTEKLESYMLWNPFNDTFQKICYPYEIVDNSYAVGFGYDHLTDDYKIVMLQHLGYNEDDVLQLYVSTYSMRRDSWQRVTRQFRPAMHDHFYGICVGNTIHWLWYKDKFCRFIAAFDLGTECLKTVGLPLENVHVIERESTLHDLSGRLCLCVSDTSGYNCNILWVMEEYGIESSWTPLCKINNEIWVIGYYPNWNNRLLCLGPTYKTLWSLSFCWFKPEGKSMLSIQVKMFPHRGPYHRQLLVQANIIPFKNKLRLRNSN